MEEFCASSVAAYPRLAWVQGRTADGEVLSAAMARSPHALVGGGTGSGKSFWASWLLTSCVLAGADAMIADGKGSSDYVPLVQHLPNVVMYTSTDAEHVSLIQWVHAEMEHRYAQQKAAAISGEVYEPRLLVVLFDEYGAFSKSINVKSHPQKNHKTVHGVPWLNSWTPPPRLCLSWGSATLGPNMNSPAITSDIWC